MAKTDAERMKEYRNRKRNAECNVTLGVTLDSVPVVPLDVYSEARWARQCDRYIWDVSRGRAYRGGIALVPVPGDPAYQGVA